MENQTDRSRKAENNWKWDQGSQQTGSKSWASPELMENEELD